MRALFDGANCIKIIVDVGMRMMSVIRLAQKGGFGKWPVAAHAVSDVKSLQMMAEDSGDDASGPLIEQVRIRWELPKQNENQMRFWESPAKAPDSEGI